MRELTFRGFLTQYVRQLSYCDSTSLYKLANEAASENARLREPLLLYALYSGKQDVLLRATRQTPLHTGYQLLLSEFDSEQMTVALSTDKPELPNEYRKVWRSYQSQKNRHETDNHTKMLILKKVQRLQHGNQVTAYRIYTDLGLNHGNVNAWLKNGDCTKVSLNTARAVLRYVEEYHV